MPLELDPGDGVDDDDDVDEIIELNDRFDVDFFCPLPTNVLC